MTIDGGREGESVNVSDFTRSCNKCSLLTRVSHIETNQAQMLISHLDALSPAWMATILQIEAALTACTFRQQDPIEELCVRSARQIFVYFSKLHKPERLFPGRASTIMVWCKQSCGGVTNVGMRLWPPNLLLGNRKETGH